MSNFQTRFMALPAAERERIATEAGMTLGYLTKHMYTSKGDPKFNFKNAVGLDRASDGLFQFNDIVSDSEGIDWKYVLAALACRNYKGTL